MTESVLLTIDQGIATITLNRVDKHNAISFALMDELGQAVEKVVTESARVLIITGSGSKAFSAGGDISDWSNLEGEQFADNWIPTGHKLFTDIAQLPIPVIAVINGYAFGGGLELAACADYRIAEEQAIFGLPEANLGMVPGWSGTQRTVRRFGIQPIKQMALFGKSFSASEALQIGMIEEITPKEEGLATANALGQNILRRGQTATRVIKGMLNIAEGESAERSLDTLASLFISKSGELEQRLEEYFSERSSK